MLTNDIIIYDDLLDGDGNLKKDNRDLVSWEPIGTPDYSGTFDGQGHTIFGLY